MERIYRNQTYPGVIQAVWSVNCATKAARYIPLNSGTSKDLDYRDAVHVDDRPYLARLLWRSALDFMRHNDVSKKIFSVHRVKGIDGRYGFHLSMIRLQRGRNNRLGTVSGVDYRLPRDMPLAAVDLRRIAHKLRHAPEQLVRLLSWTTQVIASYKKTLRSPDGYDAVSRLAHFYVSPSRHRMAAIDGSATTTLTETQAKFIALLISTRDDDGELSVVRRELVRVRVYGIEPDSKEKDDDLNHCVFFFRKFLGKEAIATIPKVGHQLELNVTTCRGMERKTALRILRNKLK